MHCRLQIERLHRKRGEYFCNLSGTQRGNVMFPTVLKRFSSNSSANSEELAEHARI